jgi:uncharacterized damage-inducible protein DinB
MNPAFFSQMLDYTYWAHRKVWECAAALTPEQFTQPLGYSWGSVRGQLVHTMWAEAIWLARIRGVAVTVNRDETAYGDLSAVLATWAAVEADWRAYATQIDAAELARELHYQSTEGTPFTTRVEQILWHVCNHGTDHRAQTLAMLHQLGVATVAQDVIFYLRR